MGKRKKLSFGNRGSPKKKKFKKEEIFNPEDSVKKYNQLLKAKNEAGQLKRCKGKTELSWEGELPVAFGFGKSGLTFAIFITFYKSSRCPDFSVKEYPKLIYREELSTLFKQWKKWKPENKLRLFLDAIRRGCQNCVYDQRKDFSPSARKWTTDLYEFIKKSKISKWFINIKESETRVRFYIKLERIKKVWDAPYFCLSFGSEDTSYDPKKDRIQFTKSCPEMIKNQKNCSDCKSPREAVKKIIQLLYKQQRIEYRSGDLVDYMALRIQKEFKALILEKSENKFVFLHKPGDEGSLNLGLTFKLEFQQESLTTFRFFLLQQTILQGKFGKAQDISWFWKKDWESKADIVIKWITRIIQGDSIPLYRAQQRMDHRKLLQDGFKKHLFFKNNAKKTSEKEQADIQSESTVPESPDPANPVVKSGEAEEGYGESDTESAPEEKRSMTPPRPLKVPVPKASESPERESDF